MYVSVRGGRVFALVVVAVVVGGVVVVVVICCCCCPCRFAPIYLHMQILRKLFFTLWISLFKSWTRTGILCNTKKDETYSKEFHYFNRDDIEHRIQSNGNIWNFLHLLPILILLIDSLWLSYYSWLIFSISDKHFFTKNLFGKGYTVKIREKYYI